MTSRVEAHEAIDAGRVRVDGAPALKPTTQVQPAQAIAVAGPPPRFVSRGGEKLDAALEVFGMDVGGLRCLDAGASTGGFTDCLLQRGAAHVITVDVGYGVLHHRLRTDERVTVLERVNARDLTPEVVPGPPVDLVVGDLSFISLRSVLPSLRGVSRPDAEAVVLVKPQFEAERGEVGQGGVVRDPAIWRRTMIEVADAAREVGWVCHGASPSPIAGPAGNVEFLLRLSPSPRSSEERRGAAAIEAAVSEAQERTP